MIVAHDRLSYDIESVARGGYSRLWRARHSQRNGHSVRITYYFWNTVHKTTEPTFQKRLSRLTNSRVACRVRRRYEGAHLDQENHFLPVTSRPHLEKRHTLAEGSERIPSSVHLCAIRMRLAKTSYVYAPSCLLYSFAKNSIDPSTSSSGISCLSTISSRYSNASGPSEWPYLRKA